MSDTWQPDSSDQNSNDDFFNTSEPEQSVWDGESTHTPEDPPEDNWDPNQSIKEQPVTQSTPSNQNSTTPEKKQSSEKSEEAYWDPNKSSNDDQETENIPSNNGENQTSSEKEEWEKWEEEQNGQSVDEELVKQQQEEENKTVPYQSSTESDTWDYTKPIWLQTDSEVCIPSEELESIDEKYLLVNRTTYDPEVWNDPLGPRAFFEEIDQGGHGRIHYCWRNDYIERTVGTSGCLAVSIVMVLHYYNYMSKSTIKRKIEDLVQFMRGYKNSQNILSKPKYLPTYDYITPEANPRTDKLLTDIPLYTADKFVASFVCSDGKKLAWYKKNGINAIDSTYLSPFEIVTQKSGKLIFSTHGGVKGGFDINGNEVTSSKEPESGYMPKGHFVVISGYNSSGMFEIADPAGDRKGVGDLAFVDPEIIKDKTFIWIRPKDFVGVPLETSSDFSVDLFEEVYPNTECDISSKWVYVFDPQLNLVASIRSFFGENDDHQTLYCEFHKENRAEEFSGNTVTFMQPNDDGSFLFAFLLSPIKLSENALVMIQKSPLQSSQTNGLVFNQNPETGELLNSVYMRDPLDYAVAIHQNWYLDAFLSWSSFYSEHQTKVLFQEMFIASILQSWIEQSEDKEEIQEVLREGEPDNFKNAVNDEIAKWMSPFKDASIALYNQIHALGFEAVEITVKDIEDGIMEMPEDDAAVIQSLLAQTWAVMSQGMINSDSGRLLVFEKMHNEDSFIKRHVFPDDAEKGKNDTVKEGNGVAIFKTSRAGKGALLAIFTAFLPVAIRHQEFTKKLTPSLSRVTVIRIWFSLLTKNDLTSSLSNIAIAGIMHQLTDGVELSKLKIAMPNHISSDKYLGNKVKTRQIELIRDITAIDENMFSDVNDTSFSAWAKSTGNKIDMVLTKYKDAFDTIDLSFGAIIEIINLTLTIDDFMDGVTDDPLNQTIGLIGGTADFAGVIIAMKERIAQGIKKKSLERLGGVMMIIGGVCDTYDYTNKCINALISGDCGASAGAGISAVGAATTVLAGAMLITGGLSTLAMVTGGIGAVLITIGLIVYFICKDSIYIALAKHCFLSKPGYGSYFGLPHPLPATPANRVYEYDDFLIAVCAFVVEKHPDKKIHINLNHYDNGAQLDIIFCRFIPGGIGSESYSMYTHYRCTLGLVKCGDNNFIGGVEEICRQDSPMAVEERSFIKQLEIHYNDTKDKIKEICFMIDPCFGNCGTHHIKVYTRLSNVTTHGISIPYKNQTWLELDISGNDLQSINQIAVSSLSEGFSPTETSEKIKSMYGVESIEGKLNSN